MLFTLVRANNALEALVYSWCLNRGMRNTKMGEGERMERESSNRTEKNVPIKHWEPCWLKYNICSILDETSN